ncbi:MAG TPA: hypothetical protein VES67_13340 [Vicinamibacterales bacterium]|nr:hypothetical protein [Vicinamibacterales bacterium]
MPDHSDLLGASGVARASRLQRAYRRRAAASHADSAPPRRAADGSTAAQTSDARCPGDAAIDFVNMTEIVARMRTAFGE